VRFLGLKRIGVGLVIGLLPGLTALGESPQDWLGGQIVDLTHAFDEQSIYWPTEDGFKKHTEFEGFNEKGYFYSAYTMEAAEHGGTHIDAPKHFAQGKWATDEIPLERLIGEALVIDVSEKSTSDRDYQILPVDVMEWEALHGEIRPGAIVLFRTGYADHWPDRKRYMGTADLGAEAVSQLHFPGIHPETANWLANQRNVGAVGIDTASIDYGQSTLFMTHRILFEKNILGFENLANLEGLPARGVKVIALPMKIRGGSGGPLRIIAVIPD